MSFYATITGYLQYRSRHRYDAAIERLATPHSTMESLWRPPTRDPATLAQSHGLRLDADRRLIAIPRNRYRALGRLTTELFSGSDHGMVVSTSTDGCFDAWIERPLRQTKAAPSPPPSAVSDITCVPLEAYAEHRRLGSLSPADDGYLAWQAFVASKFHDEYDPDLDAVLTSASR